MYESFNYQTIKNAIPGKIVNKATYYPYIIPNFTD